MSEWTRHQISRLIADLKALHPKLESLVGSLNSTLSTYGTNEVEVHAIHYWQSQALRDALIRVRIFIEKNFSYIETLGVLSLCRYTFELVVWLKHIEMDQRFALVYARELLKQQVDLYEDLAKHLQSELDLYCTLAEEEKTAHTHVLEAAASARPSSHETATGRRLAEDMHAASDTVDEKLALKFTIYSNEISHYGYSFQAHRIRTQALPQALDYADRNRDSLTKFDGRWASTISELKPKPSKQWKERAAYVNMASEYDFIYSYTSRLLHATPASLTTDQKSLEDEEALMFLRYVEMQFRWIVRHAEARIIQQ